jgi:hypothetical protein
MKMATRTLRALRERLRTETDAGVSIVEVAVAAFLIMVLSIGIMQGTVTSIRLAGDQRHRVTALSLAAGEIDLVRSMPNPFNVVSRTSPLTKTIDGTTYSLTRTAAWVTGTGTEITCGGGAGQNLLLRSVHVAVTWNGQLSSTKPVYSDTLLAPNGRINDPDLGTIVVAVTGANGQPIEGARAQIAAVSGGAITPATQPAVTNSEGCTYALEVEPGKYTVTLSLANYIDEHQVTSPVQTIESLGPGETATLNFVYDRASSYALSMPLTDGTVVAGAKYPAESVVTFLQSGGQVDVKSASPGTVLLFPRDEGYVAIAGKYGAPATDEPPRLSNGNVNFAGDGGCRALDPNQWPASTSPALAPGATDAATVGPGINAYAGYVEVKLNGSGSVTAVQQGGGTNAVPGEPGCATAALTSQGGSGAPTTFTFSGLGTSAAKLMLPFGVWKLTPSSGRTLTVSGTSNPAGLPSSAISSSSGAYTVVIDPRRAG